MKPVFSAELILWKKKKIMVFCCIFKPGFIFLPDNLVRMRESLNGRICNQLRLVTLK